jgi:hypothetical protein
MSTSTRAPDALVRQPVGRRRRQRCECCHRGPGGEEVACPRRAAFRVTVVCEAAGCTSAAGHYLICRACLAQWRATAPGPGSLRVRPL